ELVFVIHSNDAAVSMDADLVKREKIVEVAVVGRAVRELVPAHRLTAHRIGSLVAALLERVDVRRCIEHGGVTKNDEALVTDPRCSHGAVREGNRFRELRVAADRCEKEFRGTGGGADATADGDVRDVSGEPGTKPFEWRPPNVTAPEPQ